MINITRLSLILLGLAFVCCGSESEQDVLPEEIVEAPLEVGYSLSIANFTPEKLKAAKDAGIRHIEVAGMSYFVDANRKIKLTDEQIVAKLTEAKRFADEVGINIWSVHMPYGQYIDLSLIEETAREEVVAVHEKMVAHLEILEPEVILFHPSWYLELNERDSRKSQLVKSATQLDEAVRAIGATMVLENMLGPELLASGGRERPLMRTVEEVQEIFQRLPSTIQLAVDMNHIKNPENLIRAMGSRLKSVHVADGTGAAENHYFPCSGEGKNDWNAILAALYEVKYDGPFLYESDVPSEKALVDCYHGLHKQYLANR
jgi:sugar phosphate isomerase/epimerase